MREAPTAWPFQPEFEPISFLVRANRLYEPGDNVLDDAAVRGAEKLPNGCRNVYQE